MIIDNKELITVIGGATTITAPFLNSISKLITTLLDLGRSIGSAIRYKQKKISC